MSQTGRSSIAKNFYATVVENYLRVSNVPPAALQQLPLLKLSVVLTASFLTYIFVIINATAHDQQSQSQQHMLLSASSIFAAFQLGLICWLVFVLAPGVQVLFEFLAWLCCNIGIIFSSVVEAIFPVQWLKLLLASLVAVCLGELAGNDFRFNELSLVSLRQKGIGAAVIATAPFLFPFLITCLTTVNGWLCSAAGVIMVVGLRLAAVCVGVGGAVAAVLFIYGCRNFHLYMNNGSPHSGDNEPQESVIQHEVSAYVCHQTRFVMWN